MYCRFKTSCLAIVFVSTFYPGTLNVAWSDEKPGSPTELVAYRPVTTSDLEVPLDELRILVRPLTKAELEVEAQAWFDLLRVKAKQFAAVELGLMLTNKAMTPEEQAVVAETTLETVTDIQQQAEETAAESLPRQPGVTGAEESPSGATPAERRKTPSDHPIDEKPGEVAAEKKQALLLSFRELQEQRTMIVERLKVVLSSLEAKGGDGKELRAYMNEASGIDLKAQDARTAWTAIGGWLGSKEGGERWAWNIGRFFTILLFSYFAAKIVAGIANWLMERHLQLSRLAENLVSRMIKNVLMLIGLAVALTALEIDITPIIAAIGATGFIVGFALQGTLSNFASGLMILVNRPFDVGDTVSAGGVTGQIHEMSLVATTFRTFDNQTIFVPNNEIWGNIITNITANEQRRVDMEFGIGYDDNVDEAERIIREVVKANELVLEEPEPVITLHELGDSAVNIVCRPWAKTSDWWAVKTQVTRQVKQRFDQAGISFPYPQRDVHLYASPGATLDPSHAADAKS